MICTKCVYILSKVTTILDVVSRCKGRCKGDVNHISVLDNRCENWNIISVDEISIPIKQF